jgi:hypothetical protein
VAVSQETKPIHGHIFAHLTSVIFRFRLENFREFRQVDKAQASPMACVIKRMAVQIND